MPTTHTVYLPPAIDFSDASVAQGIYFQRVDPPRETESVRSLRTRRDLGDSLLGDLLPAASLTRGGRKRNNSGDGDDHALEAHVTATWSGERDAVTSPAGGEALSRRRSRRLGRDGSDDAPLAAGMSVLPALADDSILSLNTTMSDPSQLVPPTADGANTSITNLPRWTVPLARLVSLDVLLSHQRQRQPSRMGDGRVHVIICVVGTTAPAQRRTKEQRARGMDGTLWLAKWEVVAMAGGGGGVDGKDKEVGCEVRLWDRSALELGEVVRRGDVVLIEHAEFRPGSKKDKPQLVLSSSNPLPKATVLYRTLPRYIGRTEYDRVSPTGRNQADGMRMVPEDKALRPDLRMARSDPGVRRVADMARWFAGWVGGSVALS